MRGLDRGYLVQAGRESTGNPGSQEIDDDGKAVWNEREADTYYLSEELPEDEDWPYGTPVIYCYYTEPGSEPQWEQYERTTRAASSSI